MNISPSQHITRRCQEAPGRVALPESMDPRVLAAAAELLSDGSCSEIALFGVPAEVKKVATENGLDLEAYESRLRWITEGEDGLSTALSSRLLDQARAKGKELSAASAQTASVHPLLRAGEMLYSGQTDAVVAGSIATTAEVIRAGISTVGLARGCRTVSGAFLMLRSEHQGEADKIFLFADCGVVVDPTSQQLCDIAWSTTLTWNQVVRSTYPDLEPRVAFLSFSTKRSADHPLAQKVADAFALFGKAHPEVAADGELQLDAALDPAVGRRKSPGSSVAGLANCLIFPNLDAGNICYKAAQRLGGFEAIGPILQGLAKPYCDLSRGASAQDIAMAARVNILRAKAPVNFT